MIQEIETTTTTKAKETLKETIERKQELGSNRWSPQRPLCFFDCLVKVYSTFRMKRKNRVSAEPIISIYLFVTLILYRQTEVIKIFISGGMMGVEISN